MAFETLHYAVFTIIIFIFNRCLFVFRIALFLLSIVRKFMKGQVKNCFGLLKILVRYLIN